MAHKDYKALKEAIMAKAKEGMKKDVLNYVQKEMSDAIQERVYDVYHPMTYIRRKEEDGLQDKRNMRGLILNERQAGFDLNIYNVAKTNFHMSPAVYLAPLVIMGQSRMQQNGVSWKYWYFDSDAEYAKSRDFIEGTKEKLNRKIISNKLESYMGRG